MKKMKKLASLVLALAMALTLAVPAMAANADLSNHTYKAYQIFEGTQAENSTGNLGDIKWGDGIDGDSFLAALKSNTAFVTGDANVFAQCNTAAEVAALMNGTSWADDSDNAKAFAKEAYKHIKSGQGKEYGETLDAGYYLVVDETVFPEGTTNTVYNLALLQLTQKGEFEIRNKTDIPEVEKKVKDTNDTTGVTTGWQDSADYDIGDNVPFQLKATLGGHVSDYATYKVVFHDTLSAGLTYNKDAKVYFGGTEVTSSFTITESNGELTISCDNVKNFGATNNSVITVEYTAKLNDNAVIGSAGNPNEVYLEYSNNPNYTGDGANAPTGNTPEDKVIVFTYKVVVNKTDAGGNDLPGAGFTLYKKNAAGDYVQVGEKFVGGPDTTFTWEGVDDGEYKLVETTTPAGYNTIDPIEFTITAEHQVLSDNPTLTKLEGGDKFTGEVSTGALTASVVNNTGATLPETGGMGTTLFYALGAVLVIGAGVAMVTKKRMG